MSNNVKAACVLIFSRNGSDILAVSRKDDLTAFGLPGGKLEPNETFQQAAVRETLEETGYTVQISEASLKNPFEIVDRLGNLVQTYVAHIDSTVPRATLDHTETGIVKYVSQATLLKGPFSEYNKKLLEWYLYELSHEIKQTL